MSFTFSLKYSNLGIHCQDIKKEKEKRKIKMINIIHSFHMHPLMSELCSTLYQTVQNRH